MIALMELKEILKMGVDNKASDIHLTVEGLLLSE